MYKLRFVYGYKYVKKQLVKNGIVVSGGSFVFAVDTVLTGLIKTSTKKHLCEDEKKPRTDY